MKRLVLTLFCLLVVSCGGGGGSSGSSPSDEIRLSISPGSSSLTIQWHNIEEFKSSKVSDIHFKFVSNEEPPELITDSFALINFTDKESKYTVDGLSNDIAYRLVEVAIRFADNSSRVIRFVWFGDWRDDNEEDHRQNGTVVGPNHDRDGRRDSLDPDDDNDGKLDGEDTCQEGEVGWPSADVSLDVDQDGCRNNEDEDSDGDGVLNVDEPEECWLLVDCDGDEILDGDEPEGCILLADCDRDGSSDNLDMDRDNDGVLNSEDSCPTGQRGWRSNVTSDLDGDGCRNDEDIDMDGDGLIEIRNAIELNAVRYQLNGNGSRRSDGGPLDTLGCGNGTDAGDISSCFGYELVSNISLSDLSGGHITEMDATAGWQPIAHDITSTGDTDGCGGGRFTAIFDGNGFVVSGLFINRSKNDCAGLFGHASGTIRNLGVLADSIKGRDYVGALLGYGSSASIVECYGMANEIIGDGFAVGGLVGGVRNTSIVQSYAVSSSVSTTSASAGGLVGRMGDSSKIVQSYAVSNSVSGGGAGGLVGWGPASSIVQSYAVSSSVSNGDGGSGAGGLAGTGRAISIVHSYALTGELAGSNTGGVVGHGFFGSASLSYWDTETSGETMSRVGEAQDRMALRSPTDYTDIYDKWDDGTIDEHETIAGLDRDGTIYCDDDISGSIEDDERNPTNRIWDFGTDEQYPAIRCTPDSLVEQRAWWYLNTTTDKPQLNRMRLNARLNSSPLSN